MGRRNSRNSESSTEICTKIAIIINPIYIAITLPGIGTETMPPIPNRRITQEPIRIMRHIVKSDSLFMFLIIKFFVLPSKCKAETNYAI